MIISLYVNTLTLLAIEILSKSLSRFAALFAHLDIRYRSYHIIINDRLRSLYSLFGTWSALNCRADYSCIRFMNTGWRLKSSFTNRNRLVSRQVISVNDMLRLKSHPFDGCLSLCLFLLLVFRILDWNSSLISVCFNWLYFGVPNVLWFCKRL